MPDPAIVEAALLVVLLWVVIERGPAFLHAADDLSIGLFRPWRGDPWPRGVQEDDDFRFEWQPSRVAPNPSGDVDDVPMAWIEDPKGPIGSVALERPEHVEVHRAGR